MHENEWPNERGERELCQDHIISRAEREREREREKGTSIWEELSAGLVGVIWPVLLPLRSEISRSRETISCDSPSWK